MMSIEEKLGRIWYSASYDREDLYGPGGGYNYVILWTKEFIYFQTPVEDLSSIVPLFENIIKQNLTEALLSPSPFIRSVAEELLSNPSL
jgi:hypothetical protein